MTSARAPSTSKQPAEPSRARAQAAPKSSIPVRPGPLHHAGPAFPIVQTKLTVGPTDDEYEREADSVADTVMRMPNSAPAAQLVQRRCAECVEGESCAGCAKERNAAEAPAQIVRRRSAGGDGAVRAPRGSGAAPATPTAVPTTGEPAAERAIASSAGHPMPAPTRTFFETRFGADFSHVRLHTGSQAHEAAASLHARAFTHGRDVYFAAGEYAPETAAGRRLIAHELTHTLQQGAAHGMLQRDPDDEREITPEIVGQDPDLLLCFVLCELGLPPAIWRDITELFLRAVWAEYREQYGELRASAHFRTFELAFKAYSPIRTAKLILTFVVKAKGPLGVPLSFKAARKLRRKMYKLLLKKGAKRAGIELAEKIASKVFIAIEVAIAAGCAGLCGGEELGKRVAEFATHVGKGASDFADSFSGVSDTVREISGAISEIVVRAVLYPEALMETSNWELSSTPAATRTDLLALGLFFSSTLKGKRPNDLLVAHGRPINTYKTAPELVKRIVGTINTHRLSDGDDLLDAEEFVNGPPWHFFQTLADEGYLSFEHPPSDVVDKLIEEARTEDSE